MARVGSSMGCLSTETEFCLLQDFFVGFGSTSANRPNCVSRDLQLWICGLESGTQM